MTWVNGASSKRRGINFIVVSVSSALPETKRTPDLVEQIKDAVLATTVTRGGKGYMLLQCDFGLLVKLNKTQMVATVRDLKVEMLRTFERHFPGSFWHHRPNSVGSEL